MTVYGIQSELFIGTKHKFGKKMLSAKIPDWEFLCIFRGIVAPNDVTMNECRSILVVDDRADIRLFLQKIITEAGYRCEQATSAEMALSLLPDVQPAMIFLDVQMTGISGIDALPEIKRRVPDVPVVIITGAGSLEVAVAAMQRGAFDYLTKPLSIQAVRSVLALALSVPSESKPNTEQEKIDVQFQTLETREVSIVGSSPAMQEVFKRIGLLSLTPNHSSVLILGESGTGKEMIARAIHANGRSAAAPFVGINCTAIPDTLLESELFGAERGAYTGAMQRRIGKFELAGEGTIFLDEIGDLPHTLQSKLLRVLQERVIERVGSNEQIPIKARFIAATHRNLAEEVSAGRFREDLLFRLNVVSLVLPPLRDRQGDIPPLVQHCVEKYNRIMNRSVKGVSDEAMQILMAYSFPGNVRELENILERAFIFTTGSLILPQALGLPAGNNGDHAPEQSGIPIKSRVFSEAREFALSKFETEFVTTLLREHKGNVTAAAQQAELTRQHFHRLMQRYQIQAHDFRTSKD